MRQAWIQKTLFFIPAQRQTFLENNFPIWIIRCLSKFTRIFMNDSTRLLGSNMYQIKFVMYVWSPFDKKLRLFSAGFLLENVLIAFGWHYLMRKNPWSRYKNQTLVSSFWLFCTMERSKKITLMYWQKNLCSTKSLSLGWIEWGKMSETLLHFEQKTKKSQIPFLYLAKYPIAVQFSQPCK